MGEIDGSLRYKVLETILPSADNDVPFNDMSEDVADRVPDILTFAPMFKDVALTPIVSLVIFSLLLSYPIKVLSGLVDMVVVRF